jgi:hypothetical protein
MPIELIPRLNDLLYVAAKYNAGLYNSRTPLNIEQNHFDIAVARYRKQRKQEALEAVKEPWLPQTNAVFQVGNTLELAIVKLIAEIRGLRKDVQTAAAQQNINIRAFAQGIISEVRELRCVSDSLEVPCCFAS